MELFPKEAGFCPERLKNVNQYLTGLVEDGILAGAAIHINRYGKDAHRFVTGWQNIEKQEPLREDTIYLLCSLSKVFTITTLMTLYEKGLFKLEDPVSKYIPEYADLKVVENRDGIDWIVPAKNVMTIEHICTMTSGLPYGSATGSRSAREFAKLFASQGDKELTTLERAKLAAKCPLAFEPGEGWLYGYSTDVMGALIEVISGKPFGVYMKEALLDPLGLSDTAFYVPAEKRDRLVTCYAFDGKSLTPYKDRPAPYEAPAFESGGGGVYSTMDDINRFTRMLLQGGQLDGVRILSRKTVDLMRCNHLNDLQLREFHKMFNPRFRGYGYGLTVRTLMNPAADGINGSVGEWGWDGFMGTWHFVDPAENMAVTFMMQRAPGGHEDIPKRLMQTVYAAMND